MNRIFRLSKIVFLAVILLGINSHRLLAQDHEEGGHDDHTEAHHGEAGAHEDGEHVAEFDPANTAFHHISDQNVYSLGFADIPLPCFFYSKSDGWNVFMSSKFGIGHHGNGHYAVDGYVLVESIARRINDESFPKGKIELGEHPYVFEYVTVDGKEKEKVSLSYEGKLYPLENKSTLDGGLMGGGLTSFYDFSPTKNVVSLLLMVLLLFFVFRKIARRYNEDAYRAPKGIQSFMEPIFIFIQDEVAKPFLGHRWQKFLPFLMCLFFLILALNLYGQIPFFGNANVTGNLTFTMALALVTFFVVNLNGKKDYWMHVLWMPGVPVFVKPILTVVEILGLFIKPLTLMLRLAANLTAGHMIIVIFVSLLFIFNDAGQNMIGSVPGLALSVPLTMFMMALELLVALVQAFVFTILTASYIGAAIEEHH
ncbi:F0F1 ATP synthase subunit A [Membranihabitans marinus]|uniref:F0F1 ATP synthase subunit A n=1 Tax=Membranihabitans marinus TaxID=1227546 RepID=UPI001F0085BB|nr:F0F1 ATP synthase subunit A [Membranihabitans marinus]